jgi:very-short-patch-repair endonuclease
MKNHYEFICTNCGKTGFRHNRQHPRHKIKHANKIGKPWRWDGNHFCNRLCKGEYYHKTNTITKPCTWCGKIVTRGLGELKKNLSRDIFCDSSCSASYHNTKRRKSRRSKSEKLLFDLLVAEFTDMKILANDKEMLNGYEVDIALPEIKLAIEWNGIVHFKPIYGQTKLDNIQQRDVEKQKIAQKKGINLIVVPDLVSKDHYVREAFQKIKKIINELK